MLTPTELSLLKYLFEFGAMEEDTLVDYHFAGRDRESLINKGLAARNRQAGTYKLTSVGRKRAKEIWPYISRHKPVKQGEPHQLMNHLKHYIKHTLKKELAAQAMLGCGVNGCAFKLTNGRVFKISSDPEEISCAINVLKMQKEEDWSDEYPFPIVYEAVEIPQKNAPFIPTYDGLLIANGYYVREYLEDLTIEELIGGTCRKHAEEFEHRIGRPPRNSYEMWKFRKPETDHLFHKIARDIERQMGIELYDYLLDENWGKRVFPDGSYQIVYRDLACIA